MSLLTVCAIQGSHGEKGKPGLPGIKGDMVGFYNALPPVDIFNQAKNINGVCVET